MDDRTKEWLRQQAVVVGSRNMLDCGNQAQRAALIRDIHSSLINAWNHTWQQLSQTGPEANARADADREAWATATEPIQRYPEV